MNKMNDDQGVLSEGYSQGDLLRYVFYLVFFFILLWKKTT